MVKLDQNYSNHQITSVSLNLPLVINSLIIFYFVGFGMETAKYDIFNIKSEEMKYNAYFSYLRSFSEASLETLERLETCFQK